MRDVGYQCKSYADFRIQARSLQSHQASLYHAYVPEYWGLDIQMVTDDTIPG